jgi:hypothetical protein
MLKAAIILLALLSIQVAAGQELCQLQLFSMMPLLQPAYLHYKARNWVSFVGDVERLAQAGSSLSKSCLDVDLLGSPRAQQCFKGMTKIALLVAPLAVELNNSQALTNLVNNFRSDISAAYSSCFVGSSIENDELDDVEFLELSPPQKGNFFSCVQELYGLTGPLGGFIKSLKTGASVQQIRQDLQMIVAKSSHVFSNCGVPLPDKNFLPVNSTACIDSSMVLAEDVSQILKHQGISTVFASIGGFFGHFSKAIKDCKIN